jgi:hypothetical protein
LACVLALSYGCEEETTGVQQTGVRVGFSDCLSFVIWVFIDGEYQGIASTEEPKIFEVPAGEHDLYARSNMVLRETNEFFCWDTTVSVSDGSVTYIDLNCTEHTCSDTSTVE